tara:strand:+ start:612 stop:1301 length:690 start_codon:yes stop_codon:yes gene_type:complete
MNDTTDFLVPTTTNNTDWVVAEDSHLYKIFFRSLAQHRPDAISTIYLGFDYDDKIFSIKSERQKFEKFGFKIKWIPVLPTKGNVVSIWNHLATISKSDYLMIIGDDILFPSDRNWLQLFKKMLLKNNNWGWSAGYSNNDSIATQFLIHKKHVEHFGWVYPPALMNWYCDDFMFGIYPQSFRGWRKDYRLLNCGGTPRYIPNNDKNLCNALIKRYQKNLLKQINNFKYYD